MGSGAKPRPCFAQAMVPPPTTPVAVTAGVAASSRPGPLSLLARIGEREAARLCRRTPAACRFGRIVALAQTIVRYRPRGNLAGAAYDFFAFVA